MPRVCSNEAYEQKEGSRMNFGSEKCHNTQLASTSN